MSKNPIALKIAAPYAGTFYDFCVEKDLIYQVTTDFQSIQAFFTKTPDLVKYLTNPIVSADSKKEILEKTLESQINKQTLRFLLLLVKRNRIAFVETVIYSFLQLVYRLATIKLIEVTTAFPFSNKHRNKLTQKIKTLTNAYEIQLVVKINSKLIGGFLIKTNSKIIDFTVKNQLQKLANHLDSVLEI
jgi:F-type H+-transporting ATPase subunit delta